MLLPATLADWGRLARSLRETVSRKLSPGPRRRAFWERFAERAFGPAPKVDDEREMFTLMGEIGRDAASSMGRVTLVGAGPGDAELLTIKAVRALQSADVILYDDLVSTDVLELARREAKRMIVGKRGRRESCRQEDINALMVGLAGQGRHVVRLKCGDPMIFGRAGEEIAELEAAGIAVAVVPGITSALAMAASLGISLTHRDRAHSVRFVTGHARSGELAHDLDWRGLADPATTLVVYMGARTIATLAARLISEGLPDQTPLIAVAALTSPDERRVSMTVKDAAEHGLGINAELPVLIGIGQAFARPAVGLGDTRNRGTSEDFSPSWGVSPQRRACIAHQSR
jgi:uroporphyrin-III C-methyltransferase/precorrin-2 dehydrogenase/sirohydrochlorin ferrochelatase